MTDAEARAIFQQAVDEATDPDTKAMREILREFFTNANFRKQLGDYLFEVTYTNK